MATLPTDLLQAIANDEVEIVDLTQPLSESTPVIKLPPPFLNTPGLSRNEISHYDERGPAWAWYTLTLGEHVGTHLDAPIHWVTGQDGNDVAAIDAGRLIGPACVIDKTAGNPADPGYLLTSRRHQRMGAASTARSRPTPGCCSARAGAPAPRTKSNSSMLTDEGPVSPGPDVDASRWLATERDICGFGVETVGIDAGAAGGFDPPFPLHNLLLGAGRLGLTQLANLEGSFRPPAR